MLADMINAFIRKHKEQQKKKKRKRGFDRKRKRETIRTHPRYPDQKGIVYSINACDWQKRILCIAISGCV